MSPEAPKMLECQSGDIRQDAAKALGGIGSAASDAVPALKRLLGDSDWRVHDAAVEALRRIEG